MNPDYRSLGWRLSLFLTLFVSIVWLIAAAFSVRSTNIALEKVFDNDLEHTAQRLLAVFEVESFEGNPAQDFLDLLDGKLPSTGYYEELSGVSVTGYGEWNDSLNFIVVNRYRQVIFRSQRAEIESFPVVDKTGFYQNDTYRFYYIQKPFDQFAVYIQQSLGYRNSVLREAYFEQVAPLIYIIPLTILGIWMIVQLSLRAVSKFRDEIEKRGEGNLDPIENDDLPTELVSINISVNTLLARLRATLDMERRFISQAAHELRTPVAAAMAQTDRLIQESDNPQARARAENVQSSLQRLKRICEKLLQLAKAEGGAGSRRDERFDLRDVLKFLVDEFETGKQSQGRIQLKTPDRPQMVNYDLDGYAILARNLIENALVHGQGEVLVELRDDGALVVTNDSEPLSEEALAQLQSHSRELQPSIKGNGMGLLIAQKIADASGLSLTFSSPLAGTERGFQAVVNETCG